MIGANPEYWLFKAWKWRQQGKDEGALPDAGAARTLKVLLPASHFSLHLGLQTRHAIIVRVSYLIHAVLFLVTHLTAVKRFAASGRWEAAAEQTLNAEGSANTSRQEVP